MYRSQIKACHKSRIAPFIAAFVFTALFCCAQAFGASPDLNLDKNGLALRGYDPVTYLLNNRAERGDSDITAEHAGATYYFASEKNREEFLRDPRLYEPHYGGFCAYGVAVGQKFDGDPEVFAIVEGKLYLQLDRATQTIWKSELDKNIAIADRTWPVIKPIPAAALNE
ncbi:YHS domain-containing (seleno)protein [Nisaea sp.]|uniref:YHS domain-containing (seleno)protein n=1 Tax=Nisaea sp. TaxID=2024842 RepID=UPI0032989F74